MKSLWHHRAVSSLRRSLVAAALVVATPVVFLWWIGLDHRGHPVGNGLINHEAMLPAMLDGTAERPFVTRFLIPSVSTALAGALPAPLRVSLVRTLRENDIFRNYAETMDWPEESLPGCFIALCLVLLSLCAFVVGLWDLSSWAMPGSLAPPFLVYLVLPAFFQQGARCIYDLPALAFSTATLCALRRGNLQAYYLVLGLGLMNKETQILALIPLLGFLLQARTPTRSLIRHIAAHTLAFGMLVGLRAYLFGQNGGQVVELHLGSNVSTLLATVSLTQVAGLAAAAFLVRMGSLRAPSLLRSSLWAVPPLVALYAVAGVYGEIRVFLEVFPQTYLVMCCAFLPGIEPGTERPDHESATS